MTDQGVWFCHSCRAELPNVPMFHVAVCPRCGAQSMHVPPGSAPPAPVTAGYPAWTPYGYVFPPQAYSWEYAPIRISPYRRRSGTKLLRAAGAVLAMAGIIGMVLAACIIASPNIGWDGQDVSLSGTVYEYPSGPLGASTVPGAKVTLDASRTDYTDDDGYYEFSDVPAGRHTIVIEKAGFATTEEEVVITGDDSTVGIDLPMYPEDFPATVTEVAQTYGLGLLLAVLMTVSVLGGLAALRARRMSLAMAGGALAMASILIVAMVPAHGSHYQTALMAGALIVFFMGLLAFIVVFLKRDDFEQAQKDILPQ